MSPALAQNNTLFVDLNLSFNEVSVVENWADQNKTPFFLVPSNDKYIWSLASQAKIAKKKSEAMDPLDPNRTQYFLENIRLSRLIADNVVNPIHEVDNILKNLKNQGQSLSTLIISGHHSTDGTWYGEGVDQRIGLPAGYLSELVDKYPSLAQSVKTIILAGCYTGTSSQQAEILKKFKGVTLIGGYYSTGYLNENLRGSAYFKNLLKFSHLLKNKVNMSELQKQLDTTITESPDKLLSIYIKNSHGEFIAQTGKFVAYKSTTTDDCQEFNKTGYKKNLDLLNNYLSGKDSPDSAQGKNDIFNVYTAFQNNFQCLVQIKGLEQAEYRKKVSFLMRFYTAVKQNFYGYHGIAWHNLNTRYKINYKAIDDWSRLEIRDVYEQLIEYKNDPEAQHFAQALDSQLISMKCTPPSWHEFKDDYNTKIQQPLCH
jgi:hypothetical protein